MEKIIYLYLFIIIFVSILYSIAYFLAKLSKNIIERLFVFLIGSLILFSLFYTLKGVDIFGFSLFLFITMFVIFFFVQEIKIAYSKNINPLIYLLKKFNSFIFKNQKYYQYKNDDFFDYGIEKELDKKINERKTRIRSKFPYRKIEVLITNQELPSFQSIVDLFQTDEDLKNKYYIFSKVRVPDLIEVKEIKKNYGFFNKIKSKHIDVVICSLPYYEPVLCIEIQDRTHRQKKRKERDNFLKEVFRNSELPLLFLYPRDIKDITNLKNEIIQHIE